ncbi:hypothetical protein HPC49_24855, partial [Pyxidicoccus fallax]
PPSAAILLLTLVAVLAGGCQGSKDPKDGIRFTCESNGKCSQPGYVCDSDNICRSLDKSAGTRNSYGDRSAPLGPSVSSGGGGQGARAATSMMEPEDESSADRCARRCSERQSDCTVRCGNGTRCRQSCVRSTDACYAQCQDVEDAWETARRRRAPKHCMGADGRPAACSQAEEQEMRAAMSQASKMLCRDRRGRQVLCPEQLEQLEKSKRFMPKD